MREGPFSRVGRHRLMGMSRTTNNSGDALRMVLTLLIVGDKHEVTCRLCLWTHLDCDAA